MPTTTVKIKKLAKRFIAVLVVLLLVILLFYNYGRKTDSPSTSNQKSSTTLAQTSLQEAYLTGNTIGVAGQRPLAISLSADQAGNSVVIEQLGNSDSLIINDKNVRINTALDIRSNSISNLSINELGDVLTNGSVSTKRGGSINSSGLITGLAGAKLASGNILISQGSLVMADIVRINNGGLGFLSAGTYIGTQIFSSNSISDSGSLSIKSGGNNNLSLDASLSGTVDIAGISSGNINLAGGSGLSGCTVENATGNFTCSGTINGSSTGASGHWSRSGNTIRPTTLTDSLNFGSFDQLTIGNTGTLNTSGNIATSGTGAISSAGLLTAANGLKQTTGELNLNSTSGQVALSLNSSTTAFNVNNVINVDTLNGRIGIGKNNPTASLNVTVGGNIAIDLNTPGAPSGVASTGGSMATGVYYYVITANDQSNGHTVQSPESSGVSVTGPTGRVTVTWPSVAGAASYHVWRTTTPGNYSGASLVKTYNPGTTFIDTLATPLPFSPPTNATAYATLLPSSGTALFGAGTVNIGGNGSVTSLAPGAVNILTLAQANFIGLRIHNEGTTGDSTIQFDWGNGNSTAQPVKFRARRVSSAESNLGLNITTASVDTEIMRLINGRVGIRNSLPTTTLDVTGTGRFSSLLTASSGLTLSAGALNLTATSGALSLSGLGASSIGLGANALTITAGNFSLSSGGILNFGAGTNRFTFNPATGALYSGTARPARSISLAPEYAGGVVTGSGIGTITTGFCAANAGVGSLPATNTTVCNNSGETHNYYNWANTQLTPQTTSVWVKWRVPDNFSAWNTNPIQVFAKRSDSTNGHVTTYIYDSTNSLIASGVEVAGVANTWAQNTVALVGGTWTPGSYITIRIDLTAAANTGVSNVGEININYLSNN